MRFDLLAESEIRGGIRFEGANSAGPRIDISLPLVSFTPASSITPIGDEWGGLEFQLAAEGCDEPGIRQAGVMANKREAEQQYRYRRSTAIGDSCCALRAGCRMLGSRARWGE
jgi:hypothetical protein